MLHNEPSNMEDIFRHEGVVEIFTEAGWLDYFPRLQGFYASIALEFSLSLENYVAKVPGVEIPLTMEGLARVTWLSAKILQEK